MCVCFPFQGAWKKRVRVELKNFPRGFVVVKHVSLHIYIYMYIYTLSLWLGSFCRIAVGNERRTRDSQNYSNLPRTWFLTICWSFSPYLYHMPRLHLFMHSGVAIGIGETWWNTSILNIGILCRRVSSWCLCGATSDIAPWQPVRRDRAEDRNGQGEHVHAWFRA